MKLPVAIVLLPVPLAALGHEFWVEPSKFHPAVGDEVAVALRVGERFEGQPVARKNDRIKAFVLLAPGQTEPAAISGDDGADPAGTIRVTQAGAHIVGFQNEPSRIELAPAEFEEYLREEGLEAIIAERQRLGESDKPGRERYARCAKAILTVGGAGAGFERRFDFPLELIALADPSSLRPGGNLTVRAFFRGKPIAGLKLTAFRRGAADKPGSARTNADGVAAIPLDQPGVWLISAVHMIRADAGTDADWQSFWATLTFEQLPAREKQMP